MSSRGVNRVTWQLWSEKWLYLWYFVVRLRKDLSPRLRPPFWRICWWQPSQKTNPVLNLSFFIANFFCENIFYRHPSHAIPFHWIVLWANEATPLGWVFMNGIDWFSVCSLDSPLFLVPINLTNTIQCWCADNSHQAKAQQESVTKVVIRNENLISAFRRRFLPRYDVQIKIR